MEELQGSWDVFYIIQHLEMKEKRHETLFYVNIFVCLDQILTGKFDLQVEWILLNKTLKKPKK